MIRYLNNDGSRWTYTTKPGREFVLVFPDGTKKARLADFFESFGNFAVIAFRVHGRRYFGLPKASDGSETRVDMNELPHVFLVSCRIGRKS